MSSSPAEETDDIDEDEHDDKDESDDSDDDIDMSLSSESKEDSPSESRIPAIPSNAFLTANIPTPCVAVAAIRTISPAHAASHLREGVQSRTLKRAGCSALWGPLSCCCIRGSNGMRRRRISRCMICTMATWVASTLLSEQVAGLRLPPGQGFYKPHNGDCK